jgi:hypothetical protein
VNSDNCCSLVELKRNVSSLIDAREHRQPLFACLQLKRSVSRLLDGIVSCLLEGSDRGTSLFSCSELK